MELTESPKNSWNPIPSRAAGAAASCAEIETLNGLLRRVFNNL
jgi:hypothetical protein